MASLLWPDLENAAARANLRVVLADLSAELKRLALVDLLLADRETLTFRTTPGLLTDAALLTQRESSCIDLSSRFFGLQSAGSWLEGAEESTSEEFTDWLLPHREYMQQELQRVHANTMTAVSTGKSADTREPSEPEESYGLLPAEHESGMPAPGAASTASHRQLLMPAEIPRTAVVTWLRVEIAETRTPETPSYPPANLNLVHILAKEAEFFNGVMLDYDDAGASFVFGVQSHHPGQRWATLRAAAAMNARVENQSVLRMGATSGRGTMSTTRPLTVTGWRKRLADRLAMTAENGHILCDDSFADMARAFRFGESATRRFRGFDQEFVLYGRALDDGAPVLLPPRGDFAVGIFAREAFLQLTENLFKEDTRVDHEQTGVSITGESGLGKTRFCWELANRRQANGQRVFWLGAMPEARNVPLRSLHGLWSSTLSGTGTIEQRLDNALTTLSVRVSTEARRAVAGFISSHQIPQSMRAALIDAFIALLRGTGTQATLVVVDDAPLLDAATVEIINRIVQVDGLEVNWLLTCRAGDAHGLELPHLVEVQLPPLNDVEAMIVLENSPDAGLLTPQEQRKRIAHARGLPLYLLADASASSSGGHFDEFCQAMMNRLGQARSALEMAAILGMLFDTADLAALCGADRTSAACERGLTTGLLVARTDQQLSFFHPRLREHLLTSTPLAVVEQQARQAARLMAQQQRHAEAARLWQLGKSEDEARDAWRAAAQHAMEADDYSSACDSWDQLSQLDDPNTVEGVNARIALARCLIARDGYGSAHAHSIALQAHQTASSIQAMDADTAFGALALAYLGSSSQGHLQGAEYAQKMLDSATTPAQHYTAYWALGNTMFWLADFVSARGWLERNIELGLELTLQQRMSYFPSDLAVFARAEMGWLLWFVGEPEGSKQMVEEAATFAAGSSTKQDLCISSCFAGFVAWCDGDQTALPAHAEAAAATALREGFGFWSCVADLLRALAYANGARPIDLPELIRSSEGLLQGYAAARGTAHWLVAGSLVASGQQEVAVRLIEDTLAALAESEHRQCSMDLWRLKSLALAQLGRTALADTAFATAVLQARALGAHGWLARWVPPMAT